MSAALNSRSESSSATSGTVTDVASTRAPATPAPHRSRLGPVGAPRVGALAQDLAALTGRGRRRRPIGPRALVGRLPPRPRTSRRPGTAPSSFPARLVPFARAAGPPQGVQCASTTDSASGAASGSGRRQVAPQSRTSARQHCLPGERRPQSAGRMRLPSRPQVSRHPARSRGGELEHLRRRAAALPGHRRGHTAAVLHEVEHATGRVRLVPSAARRVKDHRSSVTEAPFVGADPWRRVEQPSGHIPQ